MTAPMENQIPVPSAEPQSAAPVEQPAAPVAAWEEPAAVAAMPDVVVEPISPPAAAPPADFGHEACGALAESQAVLSRGLAALSEEFAAYARHSIDAAARTAIEMLGIKTWSDAVAVNTGLARASFDQWVDSSAKVSELGVKLALESSKPFVAKFGRFWSPAHRER